MDKYLQPNSAYERLWAEYQKYKSLIIAVDYDDTLFNFHGTDSTYEQVKQLVRDLYEINCKIIIWSGSENIDDMDRYLTEQDIPYHLINENLQINGNWASGKDSRKIYANAYLDDRAGLFQVYNDLTKLVYEVKKKTFYRVCNDKTGQGLWYHVNGEFTGLIHEEFNFCANTELKMDFDSELTGWLSATDSLEDLWKWFTKEDILKLQKHGWFIHKYETDQYKFYDKFQHQVIKQGSINFLEKIVLDEN